MPNSEMRERAQLFHDKWIKEHAEKPWGYLDFAAAFATLERAEAMNDAKQPQHCTRCHVPFVPQLCEECVRVIARLTARSLAGEAAQPQTEFPELDSIPYGHWFFHDSPDCVCRYSVQRRTESGCSIVCSTPYTHELAAQDMRKIAELYNATLAVSTPPAPDEEPISIKDWNLLLLEICNLYALVTDDEDWKDADVSNMEEFDPWHALKKLAAALSPAQAARNELSVYDDLIAINAEVPVKPAAAPEPVAELPIKGGKERCYKSMGVVAMGEWLHRLCMRPLGHQGQCSEMDVQPVSSAEKGRVRE